MIQELGTFTAIFRHSSFGGKRQNRPAVDSRQASVGAPKGISLDSSPRHNRPPAGCPANGNNHQDGHHAEYEGWTLS